MLSNGLPVSNLPVKLGGVIFRINNISLEIDNTFGYMDFYFRSIVVQAPKTLGSPISFTSK